MCAYEGKTFMRKPTHMTNGIGLRRLIKFGDIGAYIYTTKCDEAEGLVEEITTYTYTVML